MSYSVMIIKPGFKLFHFVDILESKTFPEGILEISFYEKKEFATFLAIKWKFYKSQRMHEKT